MSTESDDPTLPDDTVLPENKVAPDDKNIISASTESREDPASSPETKQFSHYTLIRELGRGAQGVVYLAEDRNLRRKVALKMLSGSPSKTQRDRFRREAEIASRLDHPGICGVLEIGEEEGIPYIAMQYVRGIPLDQLISRSQTRQKQDATIRDVSKSLTGEGLASILEDSEKPEKSVIAASTRGETQDVARLIERTARALHVAHEAGLVHRDVKPGNLMITSEGNPVILDFGLARDLDAEGQTLTTAGQLLGTPAYMSVEQIFGDRDDVDRRSDIYSLAATLYECLTLQRPFDAATLEQLFQKIRSATPTNPRKLNPRINQDLRTVLEVAMDADRNRRYTTALEFAEDLRRVRHLEPIRAKAAGPVSRSIKWSRRNPGKAVGAAAAMLFVLAATGFLVVSEAQKVSMVRQDLDRADLLLTQGDFTGALTAVAQASERDPESARAAALGPAIEKAREDVETEAQKAEDFAAAATARMSSRQRQADYASLTAEIEELSLEVGQSRARVIDAFAPRQSRAEFAAQERALRDKRIEAEQLLADARNDLQLSAELEAAWGGNPETGAAFADYYLILWREASRSGNPATEQSHRIAVQTYATDGRYEEELLGRGTATVSVSPGDAEIYLFRYESYETARPEGVIPRLVPVPTRGIGRVRDGAWSQGFYPGDLCLEITDVVEGSLASGLGLGKGDLIITLNGEPCGDGLFVTEVDEGFSKAGIRALARVESVFGRLIENSFDWSSAARPQGQELDRIQFAGGGELRVDRAQVATASAREILQREAPADLELLCLRDGEVVQLRVAAGQSPGLRTKVTAYPLICAPENRIESRVPLDLDPGSYTVLVRREGYEAQRYPFMVPRHGRVKPEVELLEAGSTPPGFIYVPPGSYLSGGDEQAFRPRPSRQKQLDGFFISRTEVTYGEWFEFVNDPQVLAEIESERNDNGRLKYVPREPEPIGSEPNGQGKGWAWRAESSASTPVLAVSRTDIDAYLAWRNRKLEQEGFAWTYDLPTVEEWEKASRGVDGRFFPWGNRLDFSLTIGQHRHVDWLLDVPGGFEPRDESPFGVLDMAGSRKEWLRDQIPETDPPYFPIRGGSWSDAQPIAFHLASQLDANVEHTGGRIGLRLVIRPRS